MKCRGDGAAGPSFNRLELMQFFEELPLCAWTDLESKFCPRDV
jgi:hypothetical protein